MTREDFTSAYKRRGYLHFDAPLAHPGAAWLYVQRFQEGQPHSFLPFLGFTLTTTRIRRADEPKIPRRQRQLVLKAKKRAIKIASHHDAAIYSYYAMLVGERYEQRLTDLNLTVVPTAFRKICGGRCNIHHAKEVFDFVDAHRPCVALAFDIEKFFDRLNHKVLRTAWADILGAARLPEDHYKVFRSMTRFSWVSRDDVYAEFGISRFNPKMENSENPRPRICEAPEFRERVREAGLLQMNPDKDRGIPQGAPISALLSNLYMLRVDEVMNAWAIQIGGLYRRYCDDIMVVVPPERVDTTEFLLKALIREIDLKINDDKTERVSFGPDEGHLAVDGKRLPYLGFVFDGNAVRLRQSSLDRYYGKMRRGVVFAATCHVAHVGTAKEIPMKVRKLYLKYSYLARSQRGGKALRQKAGAKYQLRRTNFITYALRSADHFGSRTIRRQIRGHWSKLKRQIREKSK